MEWFRGGIVLIIVSLRLESNKEEEERDVLGEARGEAREEGVDLLSALGVRLYICAPTLPEPPSIQTFI